MKKGINSWSFPGGLEGTLTPSQAIAWAKQYGYQALEFGIAFEGPLGFGLSDADCAAIRIEAADAGLSLDSIASGTYWTRNLGDEDPELRSKAADDLRELIRITSALGAKTLLVIPGAVDVFFLPDRPRQDYATVYSNAVAGLKSVAPYAQEKGVRLGVENVWNQMLFSSNEMRAFLKEVDHPAVGAYVDVANLMPFGTPQEWLKTLGPLVAGVHFKDYRKAVGDANGFVDLLEGDVPWPDVMTALKEIGYNGPVVAELIPLYAHHPLVRVHQASLAMDALLGR